MSLAEISHGRGERIGAINGAAHSKPETPAVMDVVHLSRILGGQNVFMANHVLLFVVCAVHSVYSFANKPVSSIRRMAMSQTSLSEMGVWPNEAYRRPSLC